MKNNAVGGTWEIFPKLTSKPSKMMDNGRVSFSSQAKGRKLNLLPKPTTDRKSATINVLALNPQRKKPSVLNALATIAIARAAAENFAEIGFRLGSKVDEDTPDFV